MKALKIDPETKTITEIKLGKDYKEIYSVIGNGCSCFTVPIVFDNNDGLYLDDEGLLGNQSKGFIFKFVDGTIWKFAGAAVVLGCDDEGESRSCKTTKKELESMVIEWLDEKAIDAYKEEIGL